VEGPPRKIFNRTGAQRNTYHPSVYLITGEELKSMAHLKKYSQTLVTVQGEALNNKKSFLITLS
jgi:hypothetical protein